LTVCNIARNDAERRILAVLQGKADPGFLGESNKNIKTPLAPAVEEESSPADFAELANDQIVAHIQSRFSGHALARLVDAVLQAEGWATKISPAGPDGGVDILGGRGSLGLDQPRLCVQVKSQASPCDVTVYRTLQGAMQSFKAEQGLLVCWGGFNRAVQAESKQSYFSVRLWDSRDLVDIIYRNYERLPAEIKSELPLKRVWMLVLDEPDE
jgi:restriction system protein